MGTCFETDELPNIVFLLSQWVKVYVDMGLACATVLPWPGRKGLLL